MEQRKVKPSHFDPEADIEKLCNPYYLPRYEEVISKVGRFLLDRFGSDVDAYNQDLATDHAESYPVKFGYYHGMFEVLNRDYIDRLTKYLAMRCHKVQSGTEKVKIVELGAGLGRLTHFVCQRALAMGVDNFNMVATDSDEMAARKGLIVPFDVEVEDYRDSLQREPQIVVVSWMPSGHDWSVAIRNTDSVQEYIHIGQPNICGDFGMWRGDNGDIKNGFQRFDLYGLEKWQIGFRDDLYPYLKVGQKVHGGTNKSRTLSFRRV